jgi:hypothetical protein
VIVDQNFTYSNLLDALISLKIVKIELKIEIFKKKIPFLIVIRYLYLMDLMKNFNFENCIIINAFLNFSNLKKAF